MRGEKGEIKILPTAPPCSVSHLFLRQSWKSMLFRITIIRSIFNLIAMKTIHNFPRCQDIIQEPVARQQRKSKAFSAYHYKKWALMSHTSGPSQPWVVECRIRARKMNKSNTNKHERRHHLMTSLCFYVHHSSRSFNHPFMPHLLSDSQSEDKLVTLPIGILAALRCKNWLHCAVKLRKIH